MSPMEKMISNFQDAHYRKWERRQRAADLINHVLMIGTGAVIFLGVILWIAS